MKTINLNNDTKIDLLKLIDSKLLVQANSGGGKSWAIRRIVEEAFGKVQIIMIDTEGEFSNLRKENDFILVGKGADAPADPRSAELLARRLLELRASAIIDLYELLPRDRRQFVKLFFQALVNAPKELWPINSGDCLVILDEAHLFAPEKGESEALDAVTAMSSLGRKRGLGLILATQRIAKLNKDAAAECNNKLIGRAAQDIDRKRAADELGFTTKEQVISLRDLDPGEFYAFGPAISRDVVKLTIGDIAAKPPGRGESKKGAPAPTEKVKEILAKLADLPKEAAEEAKTVAELKAEIVSLRREVRTKKVVHDMTVPTRMIDEAVVKAIKSWKTYAAKLEKVIMNATGMLNSSLTYAVPENESPVHEPMKTIKSPGYAIPLKEAFETRNFFSNKGHKIDIKEISRSRSQQKILDMLAWIEEIGRGKDAKKNQVAFLSDQSPTSSGYTNNLSMLRTAGLIDYPSSGHICLTDAGRDAATPPVLPADSLDLQRQIRAKVSASQWAILDALIQAYPEAVSKAETAERAGQSATSSGYTNNLSTLRTLGLIDYPSTGMVVALSTLFIE